MLLRAFEGPPPRTFTCLGRLLHPRHLWNTRDWRETRTATRTRHTTGSEPRARSLEGPAPRSLPSPRAPPRATRLPEPADAMLYVTRVAALLCYM